MPPVVSRLVGLVLGFMLGCTLLLVLYYVFQWVMEIFDVHRVRVRIPVVLFVLPFLAGFAGFTVGPDMFARTSSFFDVSSPVERAVLFAAPFWAIMVLAFVMVFEPFGSMVNSEEWLFVAKIVLFPSFVLLVGFALTKFVVLRK